MSTAPPPPRPLDHPDVLRALVRELVAAAGPPLDAIAEAGAVRAGAPAAFRTVQRWLADDPTVDSTALAVARIDAWGSDDEVPGTVDVIATDAVTRIIVIARRSLAPTPHQANIEAEIVWCALAVVRLIRAARLLPAFQRGRTARGLLTCRQFKTLAHVLAEAGRDDPRAWTPEDALPTEDVASLLARALLERNDGVPGTGSRPLVRLTPAGLTTILAAIAHLRPPTP
jgi:hypothetical protein